MCGWRSTVGGTFSVPFAGLVQATTFRRLASDNLPRSSYPPSFSGTAPRTSWAGAEAMEGAGARGPTLLRQKQCQWTMDAWRRCALKISFSREVCRSAFSVPGYNIYASTPVRRPHLDTPSRHPISTPQPSFELRHRGQERKHFANPTFALRRWLRPAVR